MCVIAVIGTDSKVLPDDKWNNCWDKNSDGFGMMWVDNGAIQIFKSLDKEKSFYKWKEVEKKFMGDSPIILHFRIGTQGANDLENCHPFVVNNDLAFCHNGIISQLSTPQYKKTGESDTRHFNKKVLKNMKDGFLDDPVTIDLIQEYLGTDKLAFLSSDKTVHIVNAKYGDFSKEMNIWFSNTSYDTACYNWRNHIATVHKSVEHCKCGSVLMLDSDKKSGVCTSCRMSKCTCCGEKVDYTSLSIKSEGVEIRMCAKCANKRVVRSFIGKLKFLKPIVSTTKVAVVTTSTRTLFDYLVVGTILKFKGSSSNQSFAVVGVTSESACINLSGSATMYKKEDINKYFELGKLEEVAK